MLPPMKAGIPESPERRVGAFPEAAQKVGNGEKILRRALYISPIDMRQNNGMAQLQAQLLQGVCSLYDRVDLLSLGAGPAAARRWLRTMGLSVNVLESAFARLAHSNGIAWYGGGAILCNKLRWIDRFHFPVRTPLPRSWIDRYQIIVCFYPWAHRLLELDRAGSKVVVVTGDVMADRHERIGARRWITLDARDERAILQSQSRCVAVSHDDAVEFKRLYGVDVPDLQFLPPSYPELISLASIGGPARVGFLGARSFVNEQILQLLTQEDFLGPLAQAGIELVVAGGICNGVQRSTLQALEQGGARVLGRIESTRDFYGQVSAVLNPVGPSTGIKIKSVEALMAGRALITTRWGADESLRTAFPDQITYIEWPIEASALAELTVNVVKGAASVNPVAARNYAEESNEKLRSLFLPEPSR
jgi:hypothetical protein